MNEAELIRLIERLLDRDEHTQLRVYIVGDSEPFFIDRIEHAQVRSGILAWDDGAIVTDCIAAAYIC